MSGEIELVLVTMVMEAPEDDALAAERLVAVLSKYVVLTRMAPGCRNVDLCSSVLRTGRFVVVQKWESAEAQRAHFDSPEMVDMARSCHGLLVSAPQIDLLESISAHDLR
ncbi:MAG TPA: antibiotic biosynthesis monooxygenase family protein [Acidimicrobiales bacterium]